MADNPDNMVREQIVARGIQDGRVLDALRQTPRHLFLPPELSESAYEDRAIPIGAGQTISQPYIVALMSEKLVLKPTDRVLEIGAGSGYQTAILALLAQEVYTIERIPELAARAGSIWEKLQITNIHLKIGDGSHGWPGAAPFDAILAAAAAPQVPPALIAQLAPNGRLILPVGPERGPQRLLLLHKDAHYTLHTDDLGDVAFVPFIGAAGFGLPEDLGATDI